MFNYTSPEHSGEDLTNDAKKTGSVPAREDFLSSMSLLFNNLPALSFLKDAQSGIYLACNQTFANFADKQSPQDVIGLTDHELFEAKVADGFVADDKTALAMDIPHVFFEDVTDVVGSPRRFQTVKQKLVDDAGRTCVLGMSVDVTEVLKAKEKYEEIHRAYEEVLNSHSIYEKVVDALAEEYFDLFYVNIETGKYIEYGSRTNEGRTTDERRGDDFFAESQQNARSIIYEDDQEQITTILTKEELLAEIDEHGAYTYEYRLVIDGKPTYVCMKATRIPGDDKHIIIGVYDVDDQVKNRMAAERAIEEKRSYLRLSALNGNLIVLYFVDPITGHYTEYSASQEFAELGISKQGEDFFFDSVQNSPKAIHPDDLALFASQVTKENVLAAIEENGMFVLDYRLMSGDLPTYVRFKAAQTIEDGKQILIIGLLNEDGQIRQEQEYARKLSVARAMATVDSLTGVKNKHAYSQWEERINAAIAEGTQEPFAVVVCDINNLKAVNDLYGHKEGDACIKNACSKICKTFAHSPVFRIGGDEFVVILTGEDYSQRNRLMEQIGSLPQDPSLVRIGETVSAGMVEYRPNQHTSLVSVFEEADKAMYARKQYLKATFLAEEQEPEPVVPPQDAPVLNARKTLLIADDMVTGREVLGDLLEEDYDIIYANDGAEAIELLHKYKHDISLVLLDLYMPKMTGREVIAQMQIDEDLVSIPVIVLTVDQEAELDCLKIGAMDFIPKPYPDIDIIKARVSKCIELSERRELIRFTERDKLTGLLNVDYFYRYVSRFDHIHQYTMLDAIVCDVDRFHAVNKHYGRQFGDRVLRDVGTHLQKLARQTTGIACRQEGDTFLLYCVHQEDYEQLFAELVDEVLREEHMAERVTLRFGVFVHAQQEENIEDRFACAKIAADRIKDDPNRFVEFYDLD